MSEQIRPWDTLACCWDVKQPTNKQSGNRTCWHNEIEAADQPCCFTQSQYTDAGLTSPRTESVMLTLPWRSWFIRLTFHVSRTLVYHLRSLAQLIKTSTTKGVFFWHWFKRFVCWLVGCLTSQQHASVSQGRICSDNFTCCHTEIEVADQTFHLTQSQYTDTGPTSPSAQPITPGAWQGSHWSANFYVTGMTRPRKNPRTSGIRTRDLPLSRV